ncbi:helix-turn-helix transcriptional regulator [Streptomyces sp. ISL-100]|uniref:helix-turn-helix domain-containing protein n=1 Tax=Streptomyces sp. ISL-100 TaxID=2819173 RepID=UPI001BE7D54C|nr:helix-turn-helix transcriptional regulator [Streptomyces sp. ISL-100]MBT2398428.1 helix-turn-helix transcriptional regulator [Streptomyces sp. ISL-100]
MTQRNVHHGEDGDDVPLWEDQVTATVAGEVRRRRKELRMSAQDLADRCADLGHPIPRNVIANMESGRRSTLPLVDVMVLAMALDTHPVCLIYPVGYVGHVQQQPLEAPRPTWDAMQWFTGEIPDALDTESVMLRNFRAHAHHHHAALTALRGEEYERWKARTANNPATRAEALLAQEDYARQAARAKHGLRTARADIREDGGTPPHLAPELSDVDAPEDFPDTTEE